MARKFLYGNTVPSTPAITSRLGAQGAPYADSEIGKLVKGTTESGHVLCASGDQIGGQIVAVETATADGFGIGSVNRRDRIRAIADGLQATLGTGNLALGDQVVVGTAVALGTPLASYPKVAKSTIQVGAAPADLPAAGAQLALVASGNIWKVISLGSAGTGAPGTEVVIERVFNYGL